MFLILDILNFTNNSLAILQHLSILKNENFGKFQNILFTKEVFLFFRSKYNLFQAQYKFFFELF